MILPAQGRSSGYVSLALSRDQIMGDDLTTNCVVSSNGAVENSVGLTKRIARYLMTGNRLPTRWWGVSALAAAQLYRVDAGYGEFPRIPFGTRAMVNVDPQPRNALLPRSRRNADPKCVEGKAL